jgi:hypothetical protein
MALYHEWGVKTFSTFALKFFMLISDDLGGVLYLSCRQKLSSLLGNKVNHIFSVLATIDERKVNKKLLQYTSFVLGKRNFYPNLMFSLQERLQLHINEIF